MNLKIKKINVILIGIYILLLSIAILVFKDFGVSIDEESTRLHGQISLNYLKIIFNNFLNLNFQLDKNLPDLKSYDFKEYGVTFELLALVLEKIFNINDYQNIFYFKHLITHSIFLIGVIFFIKIVYENFNSLFLALFSGMCFYSTPRIFAHSFYNNKDIIFMTFFVLAIYFTINYFKNKTNINLLSACFFLALLTATRVIGIYFFLVFFMFLFLEILENKKTKIHFKEFFKIILFHFLFLYFLWPFLWADPFQNFFYAIKNMTNYPWDGSVFYLGKFQHSFYLPWHYLAVWLVVSNPFLIVLIFLYSILFFLRRIFNRLLKLETNKDFKSLWKGNLEFFAYFNLVLILFPLILIIINNSTIYTGWRHVFFIYPSLMLLSICAIFLSTKKIFKFKFIKIATFVFLFIFVQNVYSLIKYHPYQNVFFNIIAEKKANKLFEIDYWGLSNIEALKKIIKNHKQPKICNLGLMNLEQSKKMLKENEKKDIFILGQNFNDCNFIISNNMFISDPKYTKKYQLPLQFIKIDTIKRGNIVINEIFKREL